jgi:hypothetical protein
METELGTKKDENDSPFYQCEKCDFFTSHSGHWKRHLKSIKHRKQNGNKMETEKGTHMCSKCSKAYSSRSGVWKHEKVCNQVTEKSELPESLQIVSSPKHGSPALELLREAMDQNSLLMAKNCELVEKNMVLCDKVAEASSGGHHNTTNSHNNTFNLSIFLNEDCKNALSIQDFAKSLQIELQNSSEIACGDPMKLTSIITNKLNCLTQVERPVHAHHAKWYVKDNTDGWEDDNSGKMVDVVNREISKDTLASLPSKFPNWMDSDHSDSSKYAEAVASVTRDLGPSEKKKILKGIHDSCKITD